jgi:anaerobic selenocysteine-containing dehydrogenase
MVKPGTDGALACAVMHCLFRDGKADWDYLNKYTDCPRELEAHVRARGPDWASKITGCPVETIEEFARLVGSTKRAFFRLGYGFARSRNGPVNMHAATCIPAVTGAWLHEGGGAFHNNADIYRWDKSMIEGLDLRDKSIRMLDQSRAGAILCGDRDALKGGPPVTAMLIQNTNPVSVCPDQEVVKRGFARGDLFVCVHEQFMTETAGRWAPIHSARPQADRAAGRVPVQSRGDLRPGPSRRRRASGLRHDRAGVDRLVVAEVGARNA